MGDIVSGPDDISREGGTAVPSLAVFAGYLRGAGWVLDDDDGRTTLWRSRFSDAETNMRVVLPVSQEVRDYASRIDEALRVLAYVERRLPQEVAADMSFGGADNVSVRLTPDAPAGEAPLLVAHSAISALRNYVIASAAALDADSLVLPHRRPQRAESYAAQARISTQPGSFVLSLSLPLEDAYTETAPSPTTGQEPLLDVRPLPFGRRVTSRMLAAAQKAQRLAKEVGDGDKPLSSFGKTGQGAANATELEALSCLGGPDRDVYQIRFSQSPLAAGSREPTRLKITPGQQRILGEAADFLRTRQPRAGVTVIGLVVRLFRERKFGKGEVVIQGVDDDTGSARRFRVELDESDYRLAVRAHETGLQVTATGDLDIRGTRRSLRRLVSFSVLPGIEDD
ncbi:hypothetical protein [Streptosporangium sp. NPDC002721]|uniref:hypothetical protein n=1 Tax=Streptosporangium sp. NPDC002721 TaxID=3366188 RepID=UPI0036B1EF69